ncbi:MAG: leucyl/phenylalanyl-tRNA--protein transferase [Desulfobacterales bacterium]
MPVFRLNNTIEFPSPELASDIGLLAVGGDLSQERLLLAYRMGIFPWFSEDEPIMWWSPDPRLVLYPEEIRISKSLKKTIDRGTFTVTRDGAFDAVIRGCAEIRRKNDEGTWILTEMIDAYKQLHASGVAHSVEAWHGGELAGGLYGIALGGCFFGESMFSKITDASKVAFVALVEHLRTQSFHLIDCQVATGHLKRFGAREIPRSEFLSQLDPSPGGRQETRPQF